MRSIQCTLLKNTPKHLLSYLYGALTLYGLSFQINSSFLERIISSLITPHLLCISTQDSVCLVRFSVALTKRISIDFFSSGY